MGMPDLARRWSREEVLALPDDGNRYELIEGELLVTAAPPRDPSGGRTGALSPDRALRQAAPARSRHARTRRPRIRSGVFGPAGSLRGSIGRRPEAPPLGEYRVPVFIAEVSSSSTARYDRVIKRPAYQRRRDYWIIDPDSRIVERWQPNDQRPEIAVERVTWRPDPVHPALEIALDEYFGEVWGESPARADDT